MLNSGSYSFIDGRLTNDGKNYSVKKNTENILQNVLGILVNYIFF